MDIIIHSECHGLSLRPGLARALEGSHIPAPVPAPRTPVWLRDSAHQQHPFLQNPNPFLTDVIRLHSAQRAGGKPQCLGEAVGRILVPVNPDTVLGQKPAGDPQIVKEGSQPRLSSYVALGQLLEAFSTWVEGVIGSQRRYFVSRG